MTPPFRSLRTPVRLALVAAATTAALGAGAATAAAATSPLAASYNSTAAKAVNRNPAYPTCSGSGASATYNPITMSTGNNPYSQSKGSAVDLSTVVSGGAYLRLFPSGNSDQPWGIAMYPNSAPGGAESDELRWNGSAWIASGTAGWSTAAHFTPSGQAYGLYSGGFLHDSYPSAYGTFLLIDQAWPGSDTLTYTPTATSNTCQGGRAIADASSMTGVVTLYVVPSEVRYGAGTTPGAPAWTYQTTLGNPATAVADPAAGNTGWAAPTCVVASGFTASTAPGTYAGGVTCSGGTGGARYALDTTATAPVVVTPAAALTATVLVPRKRLVTGQAAKLAIRATNSGTTSASAVTSCLAIPANLVVANVNGGTRSKRTVCFTVGNLAVGMSATRSIAVRGVAVKKVTRSVGGNVAAAGMTTPVAADPVSLSIRPRAARPAVTG